MNKLKKMMTVLAVLTMTMISITSCGEEPEPSVQDEAEIVTEAEEETEDETEEEETEISEDETEDDDEDGDVSQFQELIDAVSNTVWVGMDTKYICYALAFDEDRICFVDDINGKVEGYWDISTDASHIYIYSDEERNDEIGGFDWRYDEGSDTMIIKDNIVIAETDANSFDAAIEELEKMSIAKIVAEKLNGSYWMGEDGDGFVVLNMEDSVITWATLDENAEINANAYYWGMDYDNITMYDAGYNELLDLGWKMSEDLSVLELTNSNGETVQLQETDEATAQEVFGAMLTISEVVAAIGE